VCLATLCAAVLPSGFGHAQNERATTQISLADGRLTLVAEAMSPAEALRRIAELGNARLSIGASLSSDRIAWHLHKQPIDRAVAKIAHPWNTAVVLGRDAGGRELVVREIYVFGDASNDTVELPGRANRGQPPADPAGRSEQVDRTRVASVARLGRISTDDSIRELTAALHDDSSAVRIEAVRSLGLIGTDEAIRVVAQTAMGSDDAKMRAEAERVLEASRGELARTLLMGLRAQAERSVPGAR